MIEPSYPTADCPEPQLWSAPDDDSSETEVLEFLTSLTNLIKPKYVIETGTCYGYSANAIAAGMQRGKLITCDIEQKRHIRFASERIEFRLCSSLDIIPEEPIDLLFLDSDLGLRVKEYFHFKPYLSSRAVVVIHDTGATHQEFLDRVLEGLSRELNFLILPTPRGILIGRPKP